MQEKYWKTLARLCYGTYYYDEHFRFCVTFDRTLRILLAVITASSVASWKIWEQYALLWSIIIGASQLLLIISAILPYKDRITILNELRPKLSALYIDMENQWRDVKSGELDPDKINDLITSYVNQWRKLEFKYIKGDAFPEWGLLQQKAKNESYKYIMTTVGGPTK